MSGVDLIPIETIRSAFHIEDWTQEDDMAEARLLIFDSRSLCLKACFSKLEKKSEVILPQLYASLASGGGKP